MMFIYKITEVDFLMSLCKYHDVTIPINDAAPSTSCLESHKTSFRQLFHSKFHKLILK